MPMAPNLGLNPALTGMIAQQQIKTQIAYYQAFQKKTESLIRPTFAMCGAANAPDPLALGMSYSSEGKENPATLGYKSFLTNALGAAGLQQVNVTTVSAVIFGGDRVGIVLALALCCLIARASCSIALSLPRPPVAGFWTGLMTPAVPNSLVLPALQDMANSSPSISFSQQDIASLTALLSLPFGQGASACASLAVGKIGTQITAAIAVLDGALRGSGVGVGYRASLVPGLRR
jgi:hypothetical protein